VWSIGSHRRVKIIFHKMEAVGWTDLFYYADFSYVLAKDLFLILVLYI